MTPPSLRGEHAAEAMIAAKPVNLPYANAICIVRRNAFAPEDYASQIVSRALKLSTLAKKNRIDPKARGGNGKSNSNRSR